MMRQFYTTTTLVIAMILGVLTTATAEAWIPRALVGSTRRHVPRVLPHSRHKGRDNDDNSSPSRRHMQPLSVPLWLATRPWLTHLRGGGVIASSVVEAAKSVIKKVGASKANCYAVLVTCILLETVSTSLSKYAKENSSPIHFLMACGIYIFTMCGFNMALAKIEVGVAYAMWSALGTLLVSAVGIVFFRETCDPVKILCLLLITSGVVGLNLRG